MLSTVYHKKASFLKIPLHPLAKGSPPAFPKGDIKDDDHIYMKILPTNFHDEPFFFPQIPDGDCIIAAPKARSESPA